MSNPAGPSGRRSLPEVATLFLKLGLIGFGGPAAHISLMRSEVVDRRKWMGDPEFLDLVGGANLIPGPSSTELGLLLGYRAADAMGLAAAGLLFIAPAMLIVLAMAAVYVRFGSVPAVGWLLYGVKPVVIAIIVKALWDLGRAAVKMALLGVTLVVLLLYLAGVTPLPLLLLAGIVCLLIAAARRRYLRARHRHSARALLPLCGTSLPSLHTLAAGAAVVSLPMLFGTFLKIGAVVDGVPGALVATVAIFLPAFVYSLIVFPLIPRLRTSPTFSAFLDGVNAAALGLMGAVTWTLGRAALTDGFAVALGLASVALLVRFKLNAAWIILAGGVSGVVWKLALG